MGKCGICGDPFDATIREHEAPHGRYANGILVREYDAGEIIDISVDVTSNHKGHFVFKLCSNNDVHQDPDQECFDKNPPLRVYPTGEDNFMLPDYESRTFDLKIELPQDLDCEQCILQWTYVTGNSWGIGEDGKGCVGCGPQENFRSCADIKVASKTAAPSTEMPKTSTTEMPKTSTTEEHTTRTSIKTTTKTEGPPKTTTVIETTTAAKETSTSGRKCEGVPPYDTMLGIPEWCSTNCPLGYCPQQFCICKD